MNRIGYDVSNRRVSLTDGRNHTKWWAFDMYGRQFAETNANGVLVKTNGMTPMAGSRRNGRRRRA